MAIVALTTSADQTTWADTVPGAVATGYQAQNTNIQAGYLGVDTLKIEEELILETTSDWDIKVKIKPGLIDVNGRIINVTADEIIDELVDFSKLNPATGTFSDLFLVVKNNAGVYSIEYHYPIDSGMPVYDVEKKGFYATITGERILSYRASPIFVDGYGVGLSILKTDPIAEGYIQSGGTITNTPTATLRTSLTAYEYKIPAGIMWGTQSIPGSLYSCGVLGNTFVGGGHGGAMYTNSADTMESAWTQIYDGTGKNHYAIASIADQIVVVGQDGNIITSSDAITWTERTSNTTEHLNKVAYANGLWVAAGDNGIIITSPDAITWTIRTSGTPEHLKDIIYANSLWGAVGTGGTVCRSSDGASWNAHVLTGLDINSIGYGGGSFVLCGEEGCLYTSNNLTNYGIQASNTTEHLNKVAYANGLWVAVGDNGTIITSPDTSTWTVRASNTNSDFHVLTYTGCLWFAGGNTMTTSSSGLEWKQQGTTGENIIDVVYAHEILLIAGESQVYYSQVKDLWDDRNEA